MSVSPASSVLVAFVGFVVGTVGLVVGTRLVHDREAGVLGAAGMSIVGAVVWGVANVWFGWIPSLGFALTLLVWVGLLHWRYPVGWGAAVGIGVVTWAVAGLVVYLLSQAHVVAPDVFAVSGG